MAVNKPGLIINFREIPKIHKYWGWFFSIGLLLILLGVLSISYAHWATEFTVVLLGILLTGAGILQIASGFSTIKWAGFSLSMLLGLLYIVAGILCILKPEQSAIAISLLIAALLLVGGAFRLASALHFRSDYWGLSLFNGLISVLLGILILAEWPESGMWVIGLFFGIELLLVGSSWIALSLAARK